MALPQRPGVPVTPPSAGLPVQVPAAPAGLPVHAPEPIPAVVGFSEQVVADAVSDYYGGAPAPLPDGVLPVDDYAPAAGGLDTDYADPFTETGYDVPVDEVAPLSAEVQQAAALLMQVLAADDSTEVILNGPNEILQKVRGQRFHVSNIQFGDAETYHRVINEYVLPYTDTRDRIDGRNALVAGQMELPSGDPGVPPMLARVHIVCPPIVQFAKATIAKKARYEYDLDGIAANGSMTPAMTEFLKAVARGRLNFIVSGPTGAGKTTLAQAMSRHFDSNERIIVIEDSPELRLPLADVVYLQASDPKPTVRPEDVITTEWLVKQSQRMRMDRVIVGECRGGEMAEWLIAANSGADGSVTTVHADNPRRALDKILSLATKSPTAASENTLRKEIAATVDIVVQAGLIDGRYVITAIEEVSNTVTRDTGVIATTNLFAYNRSTGRHEVKGRPSDDMVATLRQRGVPVNPNWFRGSLS